MGRLSNKWRKLNETSSIVIYGKGKKRLRVSHALGGEWSVKYWDNPEWIETIGYADSKDDARKIALKIMKYR